MMVMMMIKYLITDIFIGHLRTLDTFNSIPRTIQDDNKLATSVMTNLHSLLFFVFCANVMHSYAKTDSKSSSFVHQYLYSTKQASQSVWIKYGSYFVKVYLPLLMEQFYM